MVNAVGMGAARKEWQHRPVKTQKEQPVFLRGFPQPQEEHARVFHAVAHCSWDSLAGIYFKVYMHCHFMVLIYATLK